MAWDGIFQNFSHENGTFCCTFILFCTVNGLDVKRLNFRALTSEMGSQLHASHSL